ncbi:MAG: ABC transporter permease, partial [Gemmatimonadetes bacterium]|nr:ABC transporter permease [Gemmatimonadota bacterium]
MENAAGARRWYARQALWIAVRVPLARAWHRIGRAARVETQPEAMHASVLRTWLDTLWRDLRYAVRVLWRSPRFTVTAVTLLVLGTGATTAIYTVAYAVLVRPLPYPDAERLVFLAENVGGGVAWPNFDDWRRRAHSFESLASSLADAVLLTGGPVPRRVESRSVSSDFFHVLGVPALRGRLFDDSDAAPDAPATVVVSHVFWMRELSGAPAAIGQAIALNGSTFTVIGVLPPDFRYMTPAELYLLLEPQVAANYRGMLNRRTHTLLYGVGRLKPGVSIAAARTEVQNIQAGLALQYPESNAGSAHLVTLTDWVVGNMRPTLFVHAGAVTLLLFITCVNLAGLLLTRGAARAREFRIRAAIGGSRWSLVRQLVVEQTVLVVTGGLLGAAVGAVILTGLVNFAPRDMPRLDEIRLDLAVVLWTTLVSCACAFVFGVIPLRRTSGADGQELVIRSALGPTRSAALRWGLMMAEIAVATVLLSGSGLMVHTMVRLTRVDPGFDPH